MRGGMEFRNALLLFFLTTPLTINLRWCIFLPFLTLIPHFYETTNEILLLITQRKNPGGQKDK